MWDKYIHTYIYIYVHIYICLYVLCIYRLQGDPPRTNQNRICIDLWLAYQIFMLCSPISILKGAPWVSCFCNIESMHTFIHIFSQTTEIVFSILSINIAGWFLQVATLAASQILGAQLALIRCGGLDFSRQSNSQYLRCIYMYTFFLDVYLY